MIFAAVLQLYLELLQLPVPIHPSLAIEKRRFRSKEKPFHAMRRERR